MAISAEAWHSRGEGRWSRPRMARGGSWGRGGAGAAPRQHTASHLGPCRAQAARLLAPGLSPERWWEWVQAAAAAQEAGLRWDPHVSARHGAVSRVCARVCCAVSRSARGKRACKRAKVTRGAADLDRGRHDSRSGTEVAPPGEKGRAGSVSGRGSDSRAQTREEQQHAPLWSHLYYLVR